MVPSTKITSSFILCEDCIQQSHIEEPNHAIMNRFLHMQDSLRIENSTLTDMHLPAVDEAYMEVLPPRELHEEMDYDVPMTADIARENGSILTEEQKAVYTLIMDSVDNDRGLSIAIDACGGTGKTLVLPTTACRDLMENRFGHSNQCHFGYTYSKLTISSLLPEGSQ